MRDVDDVFVGADAVVLRHFLVGEIVEAVGRQLQSPAGVRVADDRALRLRPLQNRQIPRRPIFEHLRVGIILILQPQQHEMTRMARREAGHLDVVVHQVIAIRQLVIFSLEELLLIVVRRSPRQDGADVEAFAEDVADHVLREDAFGGRLVVQASGGVHVMIAGVPAHARQIDPPLEPHGRRTARRQCHR